MGTGIILLAIYALGHCYTDPVDARTEEVREAQGGHTNEDRMKMCGVYTGDCLKIKNKNTGQIKIVHNLDFSRHKGKDITQALPEDFRVFGAHYFYAAEGKIIEDEDPLEHLPLRALLYIDTFENDDHISSLIPDEEPNKKHNNTNNNNSDL